MKRLVPALLAFALLLFSAQAFAGLLNGKAPEFTLKDLNGKDVSLAEFKGKVVFIDFWASWCGPCKKELPELSKLLSRYPDGVAVLAINEDKVRSHAEKFLSSLPSSSKNMVILLDSGSKVIPLYSAATMPTSFIVDKNGVIRHIHFGFREDDPKSWANEIDSLLKE